MRNSGGYSFGPSMRKPSKKKDRKKLMKWSLKQLKKTREFYRVSKAIKYKTANGQGDGNVAERYMKKTQQTPLKEPRVVPQTNNFTRSSRPSSGMPSSSKLLPKITLKSMPSSAKLNNGVGSFRTTTQSFSRPTNGIARKNTNGVAPPSKTVEKPRTSYSRSNNGEASSIKSTDLLRSSSLRPNNERISPPMNTKKSITLLKPLVPSAKTNESLKSRHCLPRKEFSSVLKDDLNSSFGSSKGLNPSSFFGNSRIAVQNVNGEARKESMDEHIQLDSRKRESSLLKEEGTDAENFKSSRMKTMDCSIQLENRNLSFGVDGKTIDDKLRKRTEALSQESPETHEADDSEEGGNRRPKKRRRKLILNSDYEDDNDDDGDHNRVGVEILTSGSTTQTAVVKEVSNPFLSESLKLQQYGSLPIDEPVWSGLMKINSKENVSLAAHLSTKSCEEVWKLAGSLQPEIVVTKISRMEAWPRSFEASRPTDNNIALYFLPCQMRQDPDLYQIVKEVVENDMVLQAAIGEADMLIFPSILLPEQHQTFQGKPYLWAVFKGRKNKVATVEEKQHSEGRCAEDEMGKQQASYSSVDKEGHSVAQLNRDTGPEAPEEMERQGMEEEQNPSLSQANAPCPATRDPTMNATTSANHGQTHSSLAVPTGALFGFVVQSNPRVEQLLQEMQLEGAVMVAMRGEVIGSGLGQATAK